MSFLFSKAVMIFAHDTSNPLHQLISKRALADDKGVKTTLGQLVKYREVYPACKGAKHFPALQRASSIDYSDMLFFDDCTYGTRTRTHTRTDTHTYAHTHAQRHTYTHTHKDTHTHTHYTHKHITHTTHPHTHTHIHTHTRYGDNCAAVATECAGVSCVRTPEGLTVALFTAGLQAFASGKQGVIA
jgi:hypothetical protein